MNIINSLYEIIIEIDNSNPNIDDTVEITVKIQDFNNNPLSDINLQVSIDKGYFTKYTRNSTDTTLNTSTIRYTGVTGSDGTFTMTCKASEWGLCTFTCDTKKIQYFVNGFKTLNVTSANGAVFQVDESRRACRLKWNFVSTKLSQTKKQLDTIKFPNNKYAPPFYIYVPTYRPDIVFILYSNGQVWGRTNGNVTSRTMDNHVELFEWHY